MRSIIHLPDEVRAEAARRLDAIEAEKGVKVIFAIESGSRAWGFPSADSDYDVRFLYIRTIPDYLRLEQHRDVIETPIEGLWDVNGWDLRKALNLMRKGNAVVVEWLRSPLGYREIGDTAQALRALADRHVDVEHAIRHYQGLMGSQYRRDIVGRETVRLKKYFYSVRAAAALEWIKLHKTVPPMALPDLLEGGCIPPDVRAVLDPMLIAKASSKELGEGPHITILDDYIEAMEAWAMSTGLIRPHRPTQDFLSATDALFRKAVGL